MTKNWGCEGNVNGAREIVDRHSRKVAEIYIFICYLLSCEKRCTILSRDRGYTWIRLFKYRTTQYHTCSHMHPGKVLLFPKFVQIHPCTVCPCNEYKGWYMETFEYGGQMISRR